MTDTNLYVVLIPQTKGSPRPGNTHIEANGSAYGTYYPRSWPKYSKDETREITHSWLANALTQGFRHPMYFAAYAPTTANRRLSRELFKPENSEALTSIGGQITMQLFLADVDGPSHHAQDPDKKLTPDEANEAGEAFNKWWIAQRRCIDSLLEDHPDLFIYRSRNGYRILGVLKHPFIISNQNGEDHWTRQHQAWLNYLARKHGIRTHGKDSADRLSDWGRLNRVPHDSRDYDVPDNLPPAKDSIFGDPHNVGLWGPEDLAPEDWPPLKERVRKHAVPDGQSGAILFELFKARGLLKNQVTENEWDVKCPRVDLHSPQNGLKDYAGKTMLYTAQGTVGGIKCMSDGCTNSHPHPQDWVREFSWQEQHAARRRLGWTKLGDPADSPTVETLRARIADNYWPIKNLGARDSELFVGDRKIAPKDPTPFPPPSAFDEFGEGEHLTASDRIGEFDAGNPDKTAAQCIHQIICRMLECTPPFTDEEIFGLCINNEFSLMQHVLKQEDPSWYVEQALTRAKNALEEKTRKSSLPEVVGIDLTEPAPESDKVAELPANHQTSEVTIGMRFRTGYDYPHRYPECKVSEVDQDLAQCAFHCFGDRCRRIEAQGDDWLEYKVTHWERGDRGHVRNLVTSLAQEMAVDLHQCHNMIENNDQTLMVAYNSRHHDDEPETSGKGKNDDADKDEWSKVRKDLKRYGAIIRKLGDLSKKNNIVTLLGDLVSIKAEDLDQNDDFIVFQNAAWDAKRNAWVQPDPKLLATKHIRLNWSTPTAEARQAWLDYLHGVPDPSQPSGRKGGLGFDEETLSFIQRLIGYAALGRGNEKRFAWFRGVGDTCKSTLLKIFATVLDQYAETTPSSTWLEQKSSAGGHTDVLAGLSGVRFVWSDEFPKIARFNDALVKSMTGGRLNQKVSFKGKTSFTMTPKFTLFFASNFDPQASEDDKALATRLTSFTFTKQVPKEDQDRNFVEKFLTPDRRLAVLEWIMEGALAYIKIGLRDEPAQVSESRRAFYDSQVSVDAQLEEFVIEGDSNDRVPLTQIETRLNDIQNRTRQHTRFTRQEIMSLIKHRFPNSKYSKHSGVQSLTGIRLRPDPFAKPDKDDAAQEPDPDYSHTDDDGKYTAPGF